MAQKINVTLIDDITGEPADETVTFGLDGTSYEIDLTTKNAAALRDALAQYVGAGRRASAARRSGGTSRTRRATSPDRQRVQDIRAWARAKNIKVSERGRIAADVVAQYDNAHA